jgi:hypothetical protein
MSRSMLVSIGIERLLESIRRALWRQEHVAPENLKHRVDEQSGDHHIELVIKKDHAVW